MIMMCTILLTACGISSREVEYTSDLKSGYCGIEVPAEVCRCAFHGLNCDKAEMTKEQASETVDSGFSEFDKEGIANFKQDCESNDGRFESGKKPTCTYCKRGYEWETPEREDCVSKYN